MGRVADDQRAQARPGGCWSASGLHQRRRAWQVAERDGVTGVAALSVWSLDPGSVNGRQDTERAHRDNAGKRPAVEGLDHGAGRRGPEPPGHVIEVVGPGPPGRLV